MHMDSPMASEYIMVATVHVYYRGALQAHTMSVYIDFMRLNVSSE